MGESVFQCFHISVEKQYTATYIIQVYFDKQQTRFSITKNQIPAFNHKSDKFKQEKIATNCVQCGFNYNQFTFDQTWRHGLEHDNMCSPRFKAVLVLSNDGIVEQFWDGIHFTFAQIIDRLCVRVQECLQRHVGVKKTDERRLFLRGHCHTETTFHFIRFRANHNLMHFWNSLSKANKAVHHFSKRYFKRDRILSTLIVLVLLCFGIECVTFWQHSKQRE